MSSHDPWEGQEAFQPEAGGSGGSLFTGPNFALSLVIVIALAGLVSFLFLVENPFAPQASAAATTSTVHKPMVVIDAGIATDENLCMLKAKGYDYLCVTRSKLKDYQLVEAKAPALVLHGKRNNPIEIKSVKKENETDSLLYVRSAQTRNILRKNMKEKERKSCMRKTITETH